MANMFDIRSLSFDPHVNPEWFTRAAFGGRLLSGGYISGLTGVKDREVIGKIDIVSRILQKDNNNCAWTPNQLLKLSEKRAHVITYKINLEQCVDELENRRTIYALSPGAQNNELPAELEEATLFLIALELSNEIEVMVVSGDESKDPNQFDGMVTQLMKSPESIQIANPGITVATIGDELERMYNAIPERVLQAEDRGTLYFFGSYTNRRRLRQMLSTKNNQVMYPMFSLDAADPKNPRIFYNSVEYVPVKGIDDNTLVLADGLNLFLLTDLMGETEEIRMGAFPEPNETMVWIKGRMRLGFCIPFEDECVISSNKIAVDRIPAGRLLTASTTSVMFEAEGGVSAFEVTYPTGTQPAMQPLVIRPVTSPFTVAFNGERTEGDNTVQEYEVTAPEAIGQPRPLTGNILLGFDSALGLPDEVQIVINQRNERR